MSEHDYRRGYWQGYSDAIDALRMLSRFRGMNVTRAWHTMTSFYNRFLTPWRYNRPSEIVTPPEFPGAPGVMGETK